MINFNSLCRYFAVEYGAKASVLGPTAAYQDAEKAVFGCETEALLSFRSGLSVLGIDPEAITASVSDAKTPNRMRRERPEIVRFAQAIAYAGFGWVCYAGHRGAADSAIENPGRSALNSL